MSDVRADDSSRLALPGVGDLLQDRYRLEATIATGGMGVVMKGRDRRMQRAVAVKLLHPSVSSDSSVVERFEREVQIVKRFVHPHLIQLFDFGYSDQGAFFIVMEYLDGYPLRSIIENVAPLWTERLTEILLQALDGIAEAHHHDIVHRDIKPANILVSERLSGGEHVKVVDFGLAESLEATDEVGSTSTARGGTAMYMPPEAVFRVDSGKRADVYALGLIGVEMALGERVFEADDDSHTLLKHVEEPIPLPSNIAETPVGEVLTKAVAKEPEDRYADAEGMLYALESAVASFDSDRRPDPSNLVSVSKPAGAYRERSVGGELSGLDRAERLATGDGRSETDELSLDVPKLQRPLHDPEDLTTDTIEEPVESASGMHPTKVTSMSAEETLPPGETLPLDETPSSDD